MLAVSSQTVSRDYSDLRALRFPGPEAVFAWLKACGADDTHLDSIRVAQSSGLNRPICFENGSCRLTKFGLSLIAENQFDPEELIDISPRYRLSEENPAFPAVSAIDPVLKARVARDRHSFLYGTRTLEEVECIAGNLDSELRFFDSSIPLPYDNGRTSAGEMLQNYFLACLPPDVFTLRSLEPHSAFSAEGSARCLRDEGRTGKFLLSIRAAVRTLADCHDTVEVVDAGCGAIPIMGLYAALLSGKVNVTCLEMNRTSVRNARDIVSALGLQNRVWVIECDASRYEHDFPIDLLISETMHTALTDEPIVSIMENLGRFRSAQGLTVPESVVLKAGLVPISAFRGRNHLEQICSPRVPVKWAEQQIWNSGDPLPEVHFDLPLGSLPPGKYAAAVGCDVILPSQQITDYESLITAPRLVLENHNGRSTSPLLIDIKPNGPARGATLHIKYAPGELPSGYTA